MRPDRSDVIVFYPFFPAYRLEILQSLSRFRDKRFRFYSGGSTRAGIRPAPAALIPQHTNLWTFRVGPVTFEPGILAAVLRGRTRVIVTAPALLSLTSWSLLLAGRLLGKSVYLWGQCGKPGERGFKRCMKEVMNRLATGLLVYGESEARAACELGLSPRRVHVVRNAPATLPAVAKTEVDFAPLSHVSFVLTYIGRLTPGKKLSMLVRVARRLSDEGLSTGVIIAGDGPERDTLEHEATGFGVPTLFLGEVHDRATLGRAFQRTAVVVSPGEIGLLAVQAVAANRRVVAPDAPRRNGPEASVIVNGVSGEFFSPDDEDSLLSAVLRVLRLEDRSIDEAFRRKVQETWSPGNVASLIYKAVRTQD